MRVRITFSKTGSLRYIGHLDLNTIWERAARRAGLPLAYTRGFHPQPKMTFASALPLGFSSRCELLDMRFSEDVNLTTLSAQLQNAMPEGIGILNVQSVDEQAPPLQTQIVSAEYEVALTEPIDESRLKRSMQEVMASQALPRQRRGKSYDLRPLIEELSLRANPGPSPWGGARRPEGPAARIYMRLAAREGATGRPEEVLDVLGIAGERAKVERTGLIFKN
ncbi:MAG TPA: TIGR03936 family radical SAM-associated protein [Anaerolineales bacterium]|nr:TIGR03936 family radical SAM-associated protein [Anaerolineales bacterium]